MIDSDLIQELQSRIAFLEKHVAEQDAEGVEHHVSKATLRCFAEFLTNKS